MCGILVAFDAGGICEKTLWRMMDGMHHRGPDARQVVFPSGRSLALGHLRLKIIDVSDGANQPLVSECGRFTVVFNGEIYNYREIRSELGEDFWHWRTSSDTEVLLAAWKKWGQGALHRFVGMFAFAIFDAQERTVSLARDRFGIKPLYYCADKTGDRWAFASEIPPLFQVLGQVSPNESAIRTYLEEGAYDHTSQTFFRDISAVAAGSVVTIDLRNGHWHAESWYDFIGRVPDLAGWSRDDMVGEASRLIQQAVRSHLVADVSLGLNVSGGADSAMLISVAGNAARQRLHLFNQDYLGYSEMQWVSEIVGDNDLHVATLGADDIYSWLPATVRSQGEPFGGVTVCGYNALYRQAEAVGVRVLLDGNGVDEIFLGYQRYHGVYVNAAPSPLDRELRAEGYRKFWRAECVAERKGAAIDGSYGVRPEALGVRLRQVDPLMHPRPIEVEDPVRSAALMDLLYYKIPRGLRFNDRVSMAHSRELRIPFLDHRLVEFACGVPTNALISELGTKLLFRQILGNKVSGSVAFAAKRSVQSPQREWLARDWQSYVEALLASDSFCGRGWVDPHEARKAYNAYLAGDNLNSFFIWQWVNLELWARTFLDDAFGFCGEHGSTR
jgi:asparagine synthase (glutamine-hydrolysing)